MHKNNPFLKIRALTQLLFIVGLVFLSEKGISRQTGTGRLELGPYIKVLIVTGMDIPDHHWRETTKAISEELSKDERIRVEVLTDIYKLDTINLKKYDVVFLNFNNWGKKDPNSLAEKNLKEFVWNGGGLVVEHFASGSFENWPEFIKLAGRVWDRINTHDPRREFLVEIVDTTHPITKGLSSYLTVDELYICLTGNERIKILAKAKSVVTRTYHPMVFVLSYGKGRIFHTTLGHDVEAIHTEGTAELIRRGVAWTANKDIHYK